jgi:hypothetical protein
MYRFAGDNDYLKAVPTGRRRSGLLYEMFVKIIERHWDGIATYGSACNLVEFKRGGKCDQGQNRTADTRIFSPLTVPALCVTIGRYWYLFKRLMLLQVGRFYRFEHIVPYSSGKVVAK